MWTIGMLKRNAWNALKNYYWTGFLVCFLAAIFSDSLSGGSSYFTLSPPVSGMLQAFPMAVPMAGTAAEEFEDPFFVLVYVVTMIFSFGIAFLIYTFLVNPVEAGKSAFFFKARNGDVRIGYTFDAFRSGRYMATVKTMFLRMFYTWMWSILFIIPGVVKSLEYSLIPFLVAENPNLPAKRVFEISRRTMEGEKGKLFLLHLSLVGWYLLGLMACCYGVYFVLPYHQAVKTEFYACMRAKMLVQGITTEEELMGAAAY